MVDTLRPLALVTGASTGNGFELAACCTRDNHDLLITGSIAGFMPGTFQAVYNGSKAFLNSFSLALRHELKDAVTVTCLMPGATETEIFARADMLDTKVGTDQKDSLDR
jgi:uncharacterized protein